MSLQSMGMHEWGSAGWRLILGVYERVTDLSSSPVRELVRGNMRCSTEYILEIIGRRHHGLLSC